MRLSISVHRGTVYTLLTPGTPGPEVPVDRDYSDLSSNGEETWGLRTKDLGRVVHLGTQCGSWVTCRRLFVRRTTFGPKDLPSTPFDPLLPPPGPSSIGVRNAVLQDV